MSAWIDDTDPDGCVWIRHDGGGAVLDLLDKYGVEHADVRTYYIGIRTYIPRTDPKHAAVAEAVLGVVRAMTIRHSATPPTECRTFAANLATVQKAQAQATECAL